MALSKMTFDIFRQLQSEIASHPIKLVTVGYPDCLVNASFIGKTFGEDLVPKLIYREDSKDIINWHALGAQLDKIIETKSLLELLKIDMTVLDINEVREVKLFVISMNRLLRIYMGSSTLFWTAEQWNIVLTLGKSSRIF